MSNENISKNIRNYVVKKCILIDDMFPDLSEEAKAIIFFNSLDSLENDAELHLFTGYNIPYDFNFSAVKGTALLSRVQLYTDYYKSVKLQDRLCGTNVLRTFPKINSYEDLKRFSHNKNIQYEMLDSLIEYSDSTGYDKVLFAKCLDNKDVEYLKRFNPFFEEEYIKTNVVVDLNFIKNHIQKWQKCFEFDKLMSYHKAVDFIFDLNMLDPNTVKKLLLELFDQDLGIYSSTNAEDDVIKVDKIRVNPEGLYYMLKEYYEHETKSLKYTSSDEYDK